MNRQTWTNEKQFLRMADRTDATNGLSCALCGVQDNTMHLLFECEQYSKPIWKLLEEATNEMLHRTAEREQPHRIKKHAFLVLHRVWVGASCGHAKVTTVWHQLTMSYIAIAPDR
jgi:hypothetical protein